MTEEEKQKFMDDIFEKIDLWQRIPKLSNSAARIVLSRIGRGNSVDKALRYAEEETS